MEFGFSWPSCFTENIRIFCPEHNTETVFFDFSLTVKAVPHECVIRTNQP